MRRKAHGRQVPLGIEEYRKLLEQAEDAQDLKTLKAMRKRPLKFRKLDDFRKGHSWRMMFS